MFDDGKLKFFMMFLIASTFSSLRSISLLSLFSAQISAFSRRSSASWRSDDSARNPWVAGDRFSGWLCAWATRAWTCSAMLRWLISSSSSSSMSPSAWGSCPTRWYWYPAPASSASSSDDSAGASWTVAEVLSIGIWSLIFWGCSGFGEIFAKLSIFF